MVKKNNIKTIFGHNLRILRESKNLTQEQLAEALNLQTYQTINRIKMENLSLLVICSKKCANSLMLNHTFSF